MKALLSNDDGYLSPALSQLYRICLKHFEHIDVVAPDRNCSGFGSSLTLRHAIYTHQHTNGFVSVEGTPADCVHIGLLGLFEQQFDVVIAGINLGANLGDDVIYSGTVAAAREGRFLGCPSLAISMNSHNPEHYETAEYVIDFVISKLKDSPLHSKSILNINIPDIPLTDLKGIRVTNLSYRHQPEPIKEIKERHGQTAYWIGAPGKIDSSIKGTDIDAINSNYASITPLHADLTAYSQLDAVDSWVSVTI